MKLCEYCNEDIEIRNPTGKCDHLYYPDNVNKSFGREKVLGTWDIDTDAQIGDWVQEATKEGYSKIENRWDEKKIEPVALKPGTAWPCDDINGFSAKFMQGAFTEIDNIYRELNKLKDSQRS